MCTNRALVNSLECYMDDLVDCFEDFVKKSIIVISVAVGVLVGVIAYMLKTIADRSQPAPLLGDTTHGAALSSYQSQSNSDTSLNIKKNKICKRNVVKNNFMLCDYQDHKGTSTTSANSANDTPCYDEKLLKDIGYSSGCSNVRSGCSKTDCQARIGNQSISKTRTSIPSLPTNEQSKTNSNPENSNIEGDRESCCSMCCDDKCDN